MDSANVAAAATVGLVFFALVQIVLHLREGKRAARERQRVAQVAMYGEYSRLSTMAEYWKNVDTATAAQAGWLDPSLLGPRS
jgi:hypothetical protein